MDSTQINNLFSALRDTVSQQKELLGEVTQVVKRQQNQLDGMQEQLGMLTEVATKLAFMEERRAEDKLRLIELEKRFELVRDRVNEKFPQYDSMVDTYKSVNNKLWGAIAAALFGLVLAGSKAAGVV